MAKGLLVEFFTEAVELKARSEKEGRPFFEEREFVKIIPIGDTKTVQCKEVTDLEKQRFPEEYANFKRGAEMAFKGTPLTQWPPMRPAQIKLFNHFNVYTVEHVAELDDIRINQIGPGTREWVEKARAFLVQSRDTADSQRYAAENLRLKTEVERLNEQLQMLADKVSNMDGPERRGPGRPRKEEQVAA